MDKITSQIAQGASWFTVFVGGLTLEKFAVLIGIATSLGTFAVNWYYKRQEARRAKQA